MMIKIKTPSSASIGRHIQIGGSPKALNGKFPLYCRQPESLSPPGSGQSVKVVGNLVSAESTKGIKLKNKSAGADTVGPSVDVVFYSFSVRKSG